MNLEEKINNPIYIKLAKKSQVIVARDSTKMNYPLAPNVAFGCDHYGFVITTENNGKQQEEIYPTQCKLQSIHFEYSNIKIYEEGKNTPWIFDNNGTFKQNASYTEYVDNNHNDDLISLQKEDLHNNLVLQKKK